MDLEHLKASDGTGEAILAHIQSVRSIGSTVLDLDNIDNWNSKCVIVTGTPNANGYIDAADMTIMYGHTNSGDFIIDGYAPGYVDDGNTTSQVAIVKMCTSWADTLIDTLLGVLNADGTTRNDVITPLNGWNDPAQTWTYASGAGTNVGTFTVAGVDLTGVLNVGDKVKFTQTTVKYGIVTKVAFSTDTTVTFYMGTDYTIANAVISDNAYSHEKSPVGFPMHPAKWTETYSDTSNRSTSSPTANTWSNPGSQSMTLPIGSWDVTFKASIEGTKSASTAASVKASLSTSNNSESDTDFTMYAYAGAASGTTVVWQTSSVRKHLLIASPTAYYLVHTTDVASMNNIYFRGDLVPTTIKAVCAYL